MSAAFKQTPTGYDVAKVRAEFPILATQARNKSLVYLDNAATTQKPRAVIDAISRYYTEMNANVHRAVHALSEKATLAYEGARKTVQRHLNAKHASEIVFVRGTTEAMNLVASSLSVSKLGRGDEVVISGMEHHSGIVPWQMACERAGATLKVIPVLDDGSLDMAGFDTLLNPRVKVVSVLHVSNALGTINPIAELTQKAHAVGALMVVDGAQAAPHTVVDVTALDVDFYAFSGHKTYGPTGIGALYGKKELFEALPPYQGGGDMILNVTFEKTTYNKPPQKFEAGTPNIAGVIGLAAALDYLNNLGLENIAQHESRLLHYGTEVLRGVKGLRLIGTAAHKASVMSFVLDGVHPHDIGTIVDQEGVAIRSGHHCAQPLMDRFGVPATARASVGLYNTREDLDRLVVALEQARKVFA